MVLAPLVSRALQAPPMDHAARRSAGIAQPPGRPARHAWRSLRILRAGHAPAAVAGRAGAAVAAAVAAAAGVPVVATRVAHRALAGTCRTRAAARFHRPLMSLSNLPHDA
ncbi:hypothetical protein G6F65_012942 [Rhizopus arrhizus]|nr:hypothetical protein G6F31_017466 [Rhizopus arrhizus]KAG1239930.1 hypothetical protein G6F68_018158 [Rhizopus microsporus]KAG1270678.1 hypothetical protein G6F65_012942 [Rhizopus arrhizus]